MAEKVKSKSANRGAAAKVRRATTQLRKSAPKVRRITSYDEAHFVTYLRLLDAQAHSAAESAMIAIIRDVAPTMTRDDARLSLQSHLTRALWLSDAGYRDRLGGKRPTQRKNSR